MKDIEYWYQEIENCRKINKNNSGIFSDKLNVNNILQNIEKKQNNVEDKIIYKNITTNNISQLNKNETLGIDRNTDRKLKSGNIKIDLKLDFHGLTLDEAFNSLVYNINKAYNNNLRCLLVITGKGRNTKQNRESIKNCFEKWMKYYLIADKIIKYTDALQRDGGSGAVYILIKRNKNRFIDDSY